MSIKNLKELNNLVEQRNNAITNEYKDKSQTNIILREFFKENLLYWSTDFSCPVIFKNGEWVKLMKNDMKKGHIRSALRNNKKFVALSFNRPQEAEWVIKTISEDIALFNVNSMEKSYSSNVVYFKNGIYNHNKREWERDENAVEKYKFINFEYFVGHSYNPDAPKDVLLDKYLDYLSDTTERNKINEIEDEAQRQYKKELLISVMSVGLNFKPMRLFVNTYGKGGSGKSTYYKMLTSIINKGENKLASPIKYEDLEKNAHKSADLRNKTIMYQVESIDYISDKLMQQVKQLSSGGDEIDYNIKFGATGSMINTAKPFLNSNDMITFKDSSGAVDDRLISIAINVGSDSKFFLSKEDYDELFPNGALRKSAREYLLKLVIDNFKEEDEIKALAKKITESVNLKKEIMDNANPIKTWLIEDKTKIHKNDQKAKDLYDDFVAYEELGGKDKKNIFSNQKFGSKLLGVLDDVYKKQGYWDKKRVGTRDYNGIMYIFTKKEGTNE